MKKVSGFELTKSDLTMVIQRGGFMFLDRLPKKLAYS